MARFVVASPSFAKRKARLLQRSLADAGHPVGLGSCQDAIAAVYGHASFAEVVRVAQAPGTVGSPLLAGPVPSTLLAGWSERVASATGVPMRAALAALELVRPCSAAGAGEAGPTAAAGRFGYARFDDHSAPRGGWAATDDGRVFRFSSVSDLPASTLWWSNVLFWTTRLSPGAELPRNVKVDEYLCARPREAAQAADPRSQIDKAAGCEVVGATARAFGEVMRLVAHLLETRVGGSAPPWHGDTLRAEIAPLAPGLTYPTREESWIVGDGLREFVVRSGTRRKDGTASTLRRDRAQHARDVLSGLVPASRETRRTGGGIPDGVGCYAVDAEFRAVERAGRRRAWLTDAEAVALGRELTGVHDGIAWERACPASELLDHAARALLESGSGWADGVVLETLWRSLSLGRPDPDMPGGWAMSWQGMWVRGRDRLLTEAMADRAEGEGFEVASHGLGAVRGFAATPGAGREAAARCRMAVTVS